MEKDRVLSGSRQFDSVYKKGKSVGDKYVVVFCKKNDLPYSRFGIVASKKVGNAVNRNRARRLIKESLRSMKVKEGFDVIILARVNINGKKCDDVKKSLASAFKRTGLK